MIIIIQSPLGSSPLNPVKVYVVLLVPQLLDNVVPSGDMTYNVYLELPLLTLQFTLTDVMLLSLPEQLPDDNVAIAEEPLREFNLGVIFEK